MASAPQGGMLTLALALTTATSARPNPNPNPGPDSDPHPHPSQALPPTHCHICTRKPRGGVFEYAEHICSSCTYDASRPRQNACQRIAMQLLQLEQAVPALLMSASWEHGRAAWREGLVTSASLPTNAARAMVPHVISLYSAIHPQLFREGWAPSAHELARRAAARPRVTAELGVSGVAEGGGVRVALSLRVVTMPPADEPDAEMAEADEGAADLPAAARQGSSGKGGRKTVAMRGAAAGPAVQSGRVRARAGEREAAPSEVKSEDAGGEAVLGQDRKLRSRGSNGGNALMNGEGGEADGGDESGGEGGGNGGVGGASEGGGEGVVAMEATGEEGEDKPCEVREQRPCGHGLVGMAVWRGHGLVAYCVPV
jgi:hypothetical protein